MVWGFGYGVDEVGFRLRGLEGLGLTACALGGGLRFIVRGSQVGLMELGRVLEGLINHKGLNPKS